MEPLTATERFKRMYADAVERVCVVEAAYETGRLELANLTAELAELRAERDELLREMEAEARVNGG